MTRDIYTPSGGPPRGQGPSSEIFAAMGEAGIFQMLADFYVLLGKSEIRHLFPQNTSALLEASKRSAAFFVQITGGPPLFSQKFGEPRMRQRHLSFAIDENARKVWLDCFYRIVDTAPDKYGFPPQHLADFKRWLADFSAWMVNSAS